MAVLREYLRLRIEDFGADPGLGAAVREYHRVLVDYSAKVGHIAVLHCPGTYFPVPVALRT